MIDLDYDELATLSENSTFEIANDNGSTSRIVIPSYSRKVLPSCHCARFCSLAARDLFGIKYPRDHAWNLRYYSSVKVDPVFNNTLKQGSLIGLFNPGSRFNAGLDDLGRARAYTHVGLLVGRYPKSQEWGVLHQQGTTIALESLSKLSRRYTPVELLSVR